MGQVKPAINNLGETVALHVMIAAPAMATDSGPSILEWASLDVFGVASCLYSYLNISVFPWLVSWAFRQSGRLAPKFFVQMVDLSLRNDHCVWGPLASSCQMSLVTPEMWNLVTLLDCWTLFTYILYTSRIFFSFSSVNKMNYFNRFYIFK